MTFSNLISLNDALERTEKREITKKSRKENPVRRPKNSPGGFSIFDHDKTHPNILHPNFLDTSNDRLERH
jgi:hypothetical protein